MTDNRATAEQDIKAMLQRAHVEIAAGRTGEAEGLLQGALRRLDALGIQVHPLRAYTLHSLRGLYYRLGRFAESAQAGAQEVALLTEHLGPEHPKLGEAVEALAMVHYQARQWSAAEPLFQRAIALFRGGGAPGEVRSAITLAALGKCYQRQDRFADAATAYRAALPVFERQSPPGPELIDTLYHLGLAVARLGDPTQAEELLNRALGLFELADEPRFPLEFLVLRELAEVAEALRRPAAAEQHLRRAVLLAEGSAPPEHPALSDGLRHLARLLSIQGRKVEMQAELERALPVTEKAYGPHSPIVAGILHNLAGARFAAGLVDHAAECEERAVAIYEANAAVVGPALPDSLRCLARIRNRQGRAVEAQELAARARQLGLEPPQGGVISVGIPRDHG